MAELMARPALRAAFGSLRVKLLGAAPPRALPDRPEPASEAA
jgi:hypothetical protein